MNDITPQQMHRIELAWSVRTAIFGGVTATMLALPFVADGRLLAALIGG